VGERITFQEINAPFSENLGTEKALALIKEALVKANLPLLEEYSFDEALKICGILEQGQGQLIGTMAGLMKAKIICGTQDIRKINALIVDLQLANRKLENWSKTLEEKVTLRTKELVEAQQKTLQINRVYTVLSNANKAIVRVSDQNQLFDEICRVTVEQGLFKMAWIGMFDPSGFSLKPVSRWGVEEGFLDELTRSNQDIAQESYIVKMKQGDMADFVCNDIENNPDPFWWRSEALRRGYQSFAVFPLMINKKVIGLFHIFGNTINLFDDAQRKLLDELAIDISFALEYLGKERQSKEAEEAVRNNEIRFRELFNNMRSGVVVYEAQDNGSDFIIKDFNQAAERISKIKKEDVVNKRMLQVFPNMKGLGFLDIFQNVFHTGQPCFLPATLYKDDWVSYWAERYVYKLPTGEIVAMYDDVTNRKEEEERKARQKEIEQINKDLAQNEKALKNILYDLKESQDQVARTQNQLFQSEKMSAVGELSAGVAHEIKNPLAIILLSAESLEGRLGVMDERTKNNIQMIKDAAERANKIIVELLNFSRHTDLELKKESLHQSIDSAINLISHTAKIKNVEIRKEYDPKGDIILMADSVLLQQVFINLFNNAIDAMRDREGAITIKTHMSSDVTLLKANKVVVIEFADTGAGMPRHVLARIFEPFFTTKEQGKGTGLGLSLAYTIVQGHSGTITVDSKLGSGTKFTIVLPALSQSL